MKLLLVVAVLLVTFEFAPSALAAPMPKEDAEAILQEIRTIVDSAEDNVYENQAEIDTSTISTTTRRPPQMVSCFQIKQGYPCWDCAEWGGKHITLCYNQG